MRVRLQHCFVTPDCDPDPLMVDTRWTETRRRAAHDDALDDRVAGRTGRARGRSARCKAAVGKRVIVATTNRYASRLPALLKQAEKAAVVADKFAIGGKRAGPLPDLRGRSVRVEEVVRRRPAEVVGGLRHAGQRGPHGGRAQRWIEIQSPYLDEVLRHELGHVATLGTDDYAHDGNFWLIEGIAEYIQESGRAVGRYDGRFAVGRYVDSGKWNGSVTVPEPTDKTRGRAGRRAVRHRLLRGAPDGRAVRAGQDGRVLHRGGAGRRRPRWTSPRAKRSA